MSDLIKLFQDDFLDAWNAHNVERVLVAFADDVVVTIDPPFPNAPGVFRGKRERRCRAHVGAGVG